MLVACATVASHAAPTIGGCQVFPPTNVWNVPVNTLPLHANSATFMNTIGSTKPPTWTSGRGFIWAVRLVFRSSP